jgi:hypothetical protein
LWKREQGEYGQEMPETANMMPPRSALCIFLGAPNQPTRERR